MKKIWVHKAKSFKEAEEFDAKFWRQAGVKMRFVAAWQAIDEFYKIRGKSGIKPRLQRSVENIQQI